MKTALKMMMTAAALATFTGSAQAADADAGEKVFNKCKACHMVGENAKRRVGPPLNNIVGAKAGVQEDYSYSKSMVEKGEAGLVWDEATLSDYLENPKKVVPGGKMAFPGLKKEEDRANVIAYLKTFSK
jgi:cytochrome c2